MAADDCRAVTHTGRSVRVNMTVVRFLEMSLTDRLKRSYSAAKDKPNSKQSCTRFKGDHNSRIIKDSQSFSIPHTYGHGKTEGPLRCLGIWCT